MKLSWALFLFFFFNLASNGFSQRGESTGNLATDINFEHIGTEQGLSQSTVLCIFQDSKGFMWFGTTYGLNKYDGYEFTVYQNDPRDSTSLSNSSINDIVEDKNGNLWIATMGGGLEMFNRHTNKFTHFKNDPNDPNSIPGDWISSLLLDHAGNLWIGTFGSGISYLDMKTKRFTTFLNTENDPKSLSENDVRCIYEDSKNNLWIGTGAGGLNLFDKTARTFRRFRHSESEPNSVASDAIFSITEDKDHRLWIGAYDGGLDQYDYQSESFIHFGQHEENSGSLPGNAIITMETDKNGNLYIGMENSGLSVFNFKNKTFSNYLHDEIVESSLSSNSINSLYCDSEGNMWIGTFNAPVNFISHIQNGFHHYKHHPLKNSLSNNNVLCIYEDSGQNLWIGTDGGGLNLFDRDKGYFHHYVNDPENPKSISGNYVLSVFEDSEHTLWIGTWGDGLTAWNPEANTFKYFKNDPANPQSLGSDNVWTIFEDSDRNLWIGTFGGGLNLYHRSSGTFTRYLIDIYDTTSISANDICAIHEDKQGFLWIGTDDGLNKFDRNTGKCKRFFHSDEKNSLSYNTVNAIFEDENQNLWISTRKGLNCFDKKSNRFTVYTTADGLPADVVYGILQDDNKNLWISTAKGISKFSPGTKTFENYDQSDGLQGYEFKEGAYCKSRSGAMYFGGTHGFNEFFPDSIKINNSVPPVYITDFLLFNEHVKPGTNSVLRKPVDETTEITLSYKQSFFTFRFAALNYNMPEDNQYAYMLEGLDQGWNNVGNTRSANYTSVDPGTYFFKVKASNNDGVWNNEGASIKIIITPPFWKTWWFRIALTITLIFFGITLYNFRLRAIKKRNELLEKQVKERTSDLKFVNNQLLSHKQKLEDQAHDLSVRAVELQTANEKIAADSKKINNLYKEITDSIRAAETFQKSILPDDNIKLHFDSFIFFKPKDIVSGDFYWFEVFNDKYIVAVADCTGHGVSGAFMSINGFHLLNKAVSASATLHASDILNHLNEYVNELHSSGNDYWEGGMEISLCIIDKNKERLQYAGSGSPLYLVRNNELTQIKPDPFSIGTNIAGKELMFGEQEITLQKGDILYFFTDGYADQIGDAEGDKKFLPYRFRELLLRIHNKPMEQQKEILNETFEGWRANIEQIDDVLVLGLKI